MDWDKAKWDKFLDSIANTSELTEPQKEAFIARFKIDNGGKNEAQIADELHIGIETLKKRLAEVYKKFSKDRADLNGPTKGKFEILKGFLEEKYLKSINSGVDSGQTQNAVSETISKTDNLETEDENNVESPISTDNLPQPRNNCFNFGIKDQKYFVGRDAALAELHHLLQERGKVAVCAVSGMGGIGKTELMLQYAKQYQQQYPKGLCWVSAAAQQDIAAQIMTFTQENFSNFQPNPQLPVDSKIRLCWRQWLEQPPDGKMLLMIDDVSDPDYKNKIEPYLPQNLQQIAVLLTTRWKFGSDFGVLPLNVLHPDEALNLLKVRLGEQRINKQLDDAKQLCEWLEYLPLGLELVSHYLEELTEEPTEELSIAETLFELNQLGLKHDALRRENNQPWTFTAERGVAAAFDLSWERLDAPGQHLGLLLSLFAAAEIPWELVEKTEVNYCQNREIPFNRNQLQQSRRSLRRLHLIKDSTNTVSLHQLIRQFFREEMEVYNVN
ncbi:NB-ARC domain-containing protein [Planktothrix sp. FACHB-1365]|uniref:NB-ARC domain-containing protein n=1 Tax=Planktothrix sp. FACHB-1365 TaxID=2692855 RepID=UPI001688CDB8|nr:NB-ARC domain-containing protein [Planktothrix sp. FACHB-1365]MBD2482101.1 hypothetical protein [Planktothrix sp. FACHB-1365]